MWFGINAATCHKPNPIRCEWLVEEDFAETYVRFVHITLSLFLAEHLVTPWQFSARIFIVVVSLLGFLVCAAFVGSLTTAMTRLQLLANRRSAMFAILNRYLTENKISNDLCVRVNRNAEHA